MKNVFAIICKKCQGACCKSTVFVTKHDLEKLRKHKKDLKIYNDFTKSSEPPGDLVQDDKNKCYFLNLQTGCTLNPDDKPFDCRLFPLTFTYDKKQLQFYLNKKCPYWKEIPKEWIEDTKKWAIKHIDKHFTEEEKVIFSSMMQGYPKKQLIQV